MDYAYLGQQIRHYRRINGLSQIELAREIGLSAAHVGHIERGSRRASLETVVAISQRLSVPLDVLVFDREQAAEFRVDPWKLQQLKSKLEDAQRIIAALSQPECADG